MKGAEFIDIASVVLKFFELQEFELFVVMCWAIWTETCKTNHAVLDQLKEIRIDWVSSFLEAFRQNSKSYSTSSISINIVDHCWKPPDHDMLRLDVDARYDVVRNRFSVGAVIRDYNGMILGASASGIRHPRSVKGAELCAIRFGMELCLKLRLKCVMVFSDSIPAIQAINNYGVDLGQNGVFTLDILNMLKSDDFISISHMSRLANKVAHRLPREVSEFSPFFEWCSGDLPSWFINVVNQDIMK